MVFVEFVIYIISIILNNKAEMHFRNSSVRYVGTTVIGAIGLMSDILRNGTIGMVCVALAFQTPKTSTRSLQLRYSFYIFLVMEISSLVFLSIGLDFW